MTDFVSLNVGGTIYTTSRATLTRFPDSMLGSMFRGRLPSTKDDKGNYLIDGDGSLFRYVLNFLRRSILVLPEDFKELDMLVQEADFYQIKELIDAVTQIRNREEEKRAKSEHVKEQELLEVEHINGKYWTIYGSSEILQKIPVIMEAWDRMGYVSRPSVDPIFGPEEKGFKFSPKSPLNRLQFFRQITQLGFKLVSVSSRGGSGDSVDMWSFTRDLKFGGGMPTCTTPTKAKKILVLPEDFKEFDMLAQEADYYQIKELIDAVARAKERVKKQEFLEVDLQKGQTTFKEPLQNRPLCSRNMTDVVSLNVGGTIYTTSRATLTRFPDTMLWSMVSDRLPSIKDDKGNYLIDGDGPLFRYVLNFLRRSILVLPEDFKELDMLAQEADYYQIKELIDAVARAKSAHFKEQEVLEVERLNGHYWSIHGSSEILEKIPIVMEVWDSRKYVKRSSVDPIFGPEEGGFSFASRC
eukprot:XP_011668511.1 PREDICTED: uncharacterized protein LOC105440254 [Strongylocentrotus purpuratus]